MKTDKVFETHKKLGKYFKTSDGVPFFHESDAKNHAKGLKDKAIKEVTNPNLIEVVEDEDGGADDNKNLSVDDIKAQLPEVSDVAALELMLDTENKGKKRKTAIEAIEARITEVKEPKQD